MKISPTLFCLALLALFCCQKSYAGCTVTDILLSLKPTSSSAVTNTELKTSGGLGLSCSGLLGFVVLGNDKINVKLLSSINNMQLKKAGSTTDAIPYKLFADTGYTKEFLMGQVFNYANNQLLDVVLGSKTINIQVYLKTTPGSNVSPGVYNDTVQINWDYKICTGLGIGSLCLGSAIGNVNSTLTITLTVEKNCVINAVKDFDFGSKPLINQFQAIDQTIDTTCSKNEDYKVYFTDGNNRLANGWRRMTDGKQNFMQYNIYQNDNITVLDKNNKISKLGTGQKQSTPVKAIINPNQPELPEGIYMDQVSIVVEY